MKVLVTGVNGQLGHDAALELARRGHEVRGSGSAPAYRGTDALAALPYVQLDVTDAAAVRERMTALRPEAVLHCSAWTAVDAAEEPENREKVWALNVTAPENIASACAQIGAKMTLISTDYVFDGTGERPWKPEDVPSPCCEYGRTKLLGERAAAERLDRLFIVRTSWVFGVNGKNFVKTMLRLGAERDSLRVVDDQIGTPTFAADLARLLADMAETEKYGLYHASNEGGFVSWCDFAREIFRQAGLSPRVEGVRTAEYGQSLAKRPLNSRLDKSSLYEAGFAPLPDWRDALSRYLKETGYGTDQR